MNRTSRLRSVVWSVVRTLLLCLASLTIGFLGLLAGVAIDDCNPNPGAVVLGVAAALAVAYLAGRTLAREARLVGKRPPLLAIVIVGLTTIVLLWVLGAILVVEPTDCSS